MECAFVEKGETQFFMRDICASEKERNEVVDGSVRVGSKLKQKKEKNNEVGDSQGL